MVDAVVEVVADGGVDAVAVAAVGLALASAGEAFATAGASGRGALRPPKHAAPVSNNALATITRRRCDSSISIDIELLRISGILDWMPRK